MDYYYETGLIGSYKGHQVWITDYEDFCKEATENSDTIWAVRVRPDQAFKLVFRGVQIGIMSHSGEVSLFHKEKPFNFYYREEKKSKETSEVKEVPLEINYSDYTQPVDIFFKNLKDWWKDLDKDLELI